MAPRNLLLAVTLVLVTPSASTACVSGEGTCVSGDETGAMEVSLLQREFSVSNNAKAHTDRQSLSHRQDPVTTPYDAGEMIRAQVAEISQMIKDDEVKLHENAYAHDELLTGRGGGNKSKRGPKAGPTNTTLDAELAAQLAEVGLADIGCACNPLRLLFHEAESAAHMARLLTHSFSHTQVTTETIEFHLGAAAANMYYVDACEGVPNYSCMDDVAQAMFYKVKTDWVQLLVEVSSNTPFGLMMKAALQEGAENSGCSCDPASIAMHRVWKKGGTGNFYGDAASTYLGYCHDTPNLACGCDPTEAAFHYFGSQANSGYDAGTEDADAPTKGHAAYYEHCPIETAPNETRYEQLVEMYQTELVGAGLTWLKDQKQ